MIRDIIRYSAIFSGVIPTSPNLSPLNLPDSSERTRSLWRRQVPLIPSPDRAGEFHGGGDVCTCRWASTYAEHHRSQLLLGERASLNQRGRQGGDALLKGQRAERLGGGCDRISPGREMLWGIAHGTFRSGCFSANGIRPLSVPPGMRDVRDDRSTRSPSPARKPSQTAPNTWRS
jgi:hypothetical protein